MMNEKAQELGLDEPTSSAGWLDVSGHYSTAQDVTKLAQFAMRNPRIRSTVRTQDDSIPEAGTSTRGTTCSASSRALRVKTGHTGTAGWCEVAASAATESLCTRPSSEAPAARNGTPTWPRSCGGNLALPVGVARAPGTCIAGERRVRKVRFRSLPLERLPVRAHRQALVEPSLRGLSSCGHTRAARRRGSRVLRPRLVARQPLVASVPRPSRLRWTRRLLRSRTLTHVKDWFS